MVYGMNRAAAVAVVLVLAWPAGAVEILVSEVIWGFDGQVVPCRVNLLSVLMVNPSEVPFNGKVVLRKTDGAGQTVGGQHVQPCFLSPGASRWIQFYPYTNREEERWILQWRDGGRGRIELPVPRLEAPALVILSQSGNFLQGWAGIKSLPDDLFPTSVAATDGLDSVVLDYAPKWEMEILKELCRMGKTILISSHILSELGTLCDSMTIIDRGTIKYTGTMKALLSRQGAVGVYILTLAREHPPTEAALRKIEAISQVTKLGGDWSYQLTFDRNRIATNDILKIVLDSGGVVASFREGERKLSEAFMDLTDPGVPNHVRPVHPFASPRRTRADDVSLPTRACAYHPLLLIVDGLRELALDEQPRARVLQGGRVHQLVLHLGRGRGHLLFRHHRGEGGENALQHCHPSDLAPDIGLPEGGRLSDRIGSCFLLLLPRCTACIAVFRGGLHSHRRGRGRLVQHPARAVLPPPCRVSVLNPPSWHTGHACSLSGAFHWRDVILPDRLRVPLLPPWDGFGRGFHLCVFCGFVVLTAVLHYAIGPMIRKAAAE